MRSFAQGGRLASHALAERAARDHFGGAGAQALAEVGLKAGMDSLAGDALAREVIAAAGYAEAFGHSLGHGVGLAVHETPNLSPSEARRSVLPAGCVLTVEPGIYLEGWGGVRLEDMVLLHPEVAEVLNHPGYFYEWD